MNGVVDVVDHVQCLDQRELIDHVQCLDQRELIKQIEFAQSDGNGGKVGFHPSLLSAPIKTDTRLIIYVYV